MKQKQAQALQAAWGDKPCDHTALAREYDQAGDRTGNFICKQCGRTFTFQQRAELLAVLGEAPASRDVAS